MSAKNAQPRGWILPPLIYDQAYSCQSLPWVYDKLVWMKYANSNVFWQRSPEFYLKLVLKSTFSIGFLKQYTKANVLKNMKKKKTKQIFLPDISPCRNKLLGQLTCGGSICNIILLPEALFLAGTSFKALVLSLMSKHECNYRFLSRSRILKIKKKTNPDHHFQLILSKPNEHFEVAQNQQLNVKWYFMGKHSKYKRYTCINLSYSRL